MKTLIQAKTEAAEIEKEQKQYTSGNSQLLVDYRNALIKAHQLGEDIKELYGIVPPRCIVETDVRRMLNSRVPQAVRGADVIISLNIS